MNEIQSNSTLPQIGSVYAMKGCPHCKAKPIFGLRIQEGLRHYKINCLQHPDFLVALAWFEDSSLIMEEWQDDEGYIRLGAPPDVVLSRPVYSVVLSEI